MTDRNKSAGKLYQQVYGVKKVTEVERLQQRVEKMRVEQGLTGVNFFPGNVEGKTVEDVAKEANDLHDAIEAGNFEEFKFNDSKLRGKQFSGVMFDDASGFENSKELIDAAFRLHGIMNCEGRKYGVGRRDPETKGNKRD